MADYEDKIDEMEEMAEDDEVLELVGDDGNVVHFYHIATLEYNKKWYVLLQPAEEIPDISMDETIIFELGADANGDDVFLPIEDESIIDAVYDEYCKLQDDDGCDCDDCNCDECDDCDDDDCDCGCHDHKN